MASCHCKAEAEAKTPPKIQRFSENWLQAQDASVISQAKSCSKQEKASKWGLMLSCPEEKAQAETVLPGRVILEMLSKETARYLFLLHS